MIDQRRTPHQAEPAIGRSPRIGGRVHLSGLPELDLFESDEQRLGAIREIEDGMSPKGVVAWVQFVLIVGGICFVFQRVVTWVIRMLSPLTSTTNGWIGAAATIVVFIAVIAWLMRTDHVKALRRKLLDFGIPVCLKCGYGLRGVTSGRCPECGRRLSRRVMRLLERE